MRKYILRFKEDPNGFSLIELIVSILIMSVISAMIVMLISSSRATYNSVNTDTVLQGDAELVRKFISELALEAKSWGSKSDFTDPSDGKEYKLFWIKALDNDKEGLERGSYNYTYSVVSGENTISVTEPRTFYYYVFLLRPDEDTLAYGKYEYGQLVKNGVFLDSNVTLSAPDYYGNNILTDQYSIIAEHVVDISCNSSDATGGELMSINLQLQYNDHNYTATINYSGRNVVSSGD